MIPIRIQRLLKAHILNCSPDNLISHSPNLSAEQELTYKQLATRFQAGEPLSRIMGVREFWSLEFFLNEDTLDPRPDSETLIEVVIKTFPLKDRPITILDLGTGTGCLAISLLTEYPNARATLVDVSESALQQAKKNAAHNTVQDRCQFVKSDWLECFAEAFTCTLVIANPPYIKEQAYPYLNENVKNFDPKRALVSGETGTEAYEKILHQLKQKSLSFEAGFFEISPEQEADVTHLIQLNGLNPVQTLPDIEGRPRVILFTPPSH